MMIIMVLHCQKKILLRKKRYFLLGVKLYRVNASSLQVVKNDEHQGQKQKLEVEKGELTCELISSNGSA